MATNKRSVIPAEAEDNIKKSIVDVSGRNFKALNASFFQGLGPVVQPETMDLYGARRALQKASKMAVASRHGFFSSKDAIGADQPVAVNHQKRRNSL